VFDFIADNRAIIAAVLIFALVLAFAISIVIGRKKHSKSGQEQVFGDPERTKGGWYWSLCGISALLLIWFYFSWGVARAYFPDSANELCQVAKLDEALSPIRAVLPIESRSYQSTQMVARNHRQIETLRENIPLGAFGSDEQISLGYLIDDVQSLLALSSDPMQQSPEAAAQIALLSQELRALALDLIQSPKDIRVTQEALSQPKWDINYIEIPLLPLTARGILFDIAAQKAALFAAEFVTLRNIPPAYATRVPLIAQKLEQLTAATAAGQFSSTQVVLRNDYIKSLDRIFNRLDDGRVFPAGTFAPLMIAMGELASAQAQAKGSLKVIDALFFPGSGVVKSRTQCSEQGSGRWLPKPMDVVVTFAELANPDTDAGGGFKGTPLLWWKWLPVSNFVAFVLPDSLADLWPGDYARHGVDGKVQENFKDRLLALAQGNIYLGAVPALDGHLWDSLFRVLVALALGILCGVPVGIYMGVSRFIKGVLDPVVELYRPVPPLAWAPLILTIFGIQDDGKIFLLFMVAFAIMVISARTGAIGTQLSKIRASHSLGATDRQILMHVILPNALPEILTGVRIAIGVCWGTLVAAEMLAGTTGIGFIENVARTVSDYELIWVTILIMGILGLAFDLIMRWVIEKTIPWRGKG
jgi:taurine transport system permease protein